jgi:hypothetical protein
VFGEKEDIHETDEIDAVGGGDSLVAVAFNADE